MTAEQNLSTYRKVVTSCRVGIGGAFLSVLVLHGNLMALPTIHTPDPEISIVFQGNWKNTLKPARFSRATPTKRPWMVDANNHYGGWYPAIDVKYATRAYLFCEKNLPLVLTGWQYTIQHCRVPNGGICPCEVSAPRAQFGLTNRRTRQP